MKKISANCTILLILFTSISLNTVALAQYFEYRDIFFTDKNHGWIVGYTHNSTDRLGVGLVLRTTDGGLNWEEIIVDHPPDHFLEFEKVFFLNKNIGWSISTLGIYKSLDGGRNWFFQAQYDIFFDLFDIFFINENIGWVTAKYSGIRSQNAIYNTYNGGDTWEPHIFENMYDPFYSITFIDSLDGWAVGGGLERSGTYHYHTTDGGESWNGWIDYGYDPMFDSAYVDKNNFWAAGSEVLRTYDGGLNLHIVNDSIFVYSLSVIGTMEAWCLNSLSSVLHTIDGGYTWLPVVMTSINKNIQNTPSSQLFQSYQN